MARPMVSDELNALVIMETILDLPRLSVSKDHTLSGKPVASPRGQFPNVPDSNQIAREHIGRRRAKLLRTTIHLENRKRKF